MILMIVGALWGVSLGHFCNIIRLFFLSVILGAILELPWLWGCHGGGQAGGQARVRVLFRTRLLRVMGMI